MLECEIAHSRGAGEGVPEGLDALKGKVAFLAAAIELPDLAFADMKQLKAADINASAISSKGFIVGKPVPWVPHPTSTSSFPFFPSTGLK